MNEVYEFRRTTNRGVVWLSASAVVMVMLAVIVADADQLMWLVWAMGAVTLGWMFLPQPASGIRIDEEFLVLSAWRNPHRIPLREIAFLRATEASAETDIAIVYKDGSEIGTFTGDMPDIQTLIEVLALRGIAVRDVDLP